MRKHEEYDYQVAVFQWAAWQQQQYPELEFMFAVMNETRGISLAKGARDKKQGKKSGVPDIWLPSPRGGYHGLIIEMKSTKGVTSENQKKYLEFLKKQGYMNAVCNSPESAIQKLKNYLDIPSDCKEQTHNNGGKRRNHQCFSIEAL